MSYLLLELILLQKYFLLLLSLSFPFDLSFVIWMWNYWTLNELKSFKYSVIVTVTTVSNIIFLFYSWRCLVQLY